MPRILVPKSQKQLARYRRNVKRGEMEQFKGAFGERVFIRKTKGDWSPARRTMSEAWRRRETKKTIKRVAKSSALHGSGILRGNDVFKKVGVL